MSLSTDIESVRDGIRAGRFGNEASVSQGIVLRLLQALGWPTYDTQIVCPEFALEGRRVDFALCHPPNKPVAFIEVKQIGQSDGAERQLFEYAFHVGVQLAVLTDGQEWNFFLPAGQGNYAERRVYKLDVLERELTESVARMERYLGYSQVTSGAALEAAGEDYRNVSRNRQMLATLPQAWLKLVLEGDDLLLELLADKVESLCGFKPELDSVSRFLREDVVLQSRQLGFNPSPKPMGNRSAAERPQRLASQSFSLPPTDPMRIALRSDALGFTLDGRFVSCRNGKGVFIGVLNALAQRDPSFLERFAARPKHGRTRRYVARKPEELYPGRPDLAREHCEQLQAQWYVGTNVSRAQIERIIEMACEVSGIQLGRELVVAIGE